MVVGLSVLLHRAPTTSPSGPPAPFVVPPISGKVQQAVDPGGWLESIWVCVGISAVTVLIVFFAVLRPIRRGAWTGAAGRRQRGLVVASGSLSFVCLLVAVAAGVNTSVGYVRNLHELKNLLFSDNVGTLASSLPAGPKSAHTPTPRVLSTGSANRGRPGSTSTSAGASPPAAPVAVAPLSASEVVQIPLAAPEYGLPNAPAYVYLPKGYASTGAQWPLLLLIPAAPGSTDDWIHPGNVDKAMDSLVARGIVKPFVIVMPTVNPSFFVDNECLDTLNGPKVETYLLRVVMPSLEEQLNVSGDAHEHAIAGFSAGADCALNVGLHHLDVFSAIGAMDPEGSPGPKASHRYLEDRPSLIAQNSPNSYIPSMIFSHPVVVYLNAAGALGVEHTDQLQREFESRGVYVFRHDEKGLGHNWRDARFDEPWMLSFFSAAFNAPPPAIASGAPSN